MFNLKKKKIASIFKKYKVEHNVNIKYFNGKYGEHVAFILKPVVVISEKYEDNRCIREEITLERGTFVRLLNNNWYQAYHTPHDDLIYFQILDERCRFDLKDPRVKNISTHLYIHKDCLDRYAVACREDIELLLNVPGDQIRLDLETLKSSSSRKEDELLRMFFKLIDMFENFDPLIVNQFAPGTVDTLKNLLFILDNSMSYSDNDKLVQETISYVDSVYDTILSFGEPMDYFESPLTLIEQKRMEDEKERKERSEEYDRQVKEYNKRRRDFLDKVTYRKELLHDFNEPLSNIPSKLAKKDRELKDRWKKK